MVIRNSEQYLHHIKNDVDRFEMRKILDKITIVQKSHRVEITDFLNPYQIMLAESILNRFSDVLYTVDGGYSNAELKIIYLYPSYWEMPEEAIRIFKFESFEGVSHPQILGSLLGLGIERKKIGDILIGKKFTYFFVKDEISDFIQLHCHKISKYSISLKRVTTLEEEPIEEFIEKKIIVSSLRLDTVISSSFHLSRKKVTELICGEKVKLNYKLEIKVSKEVNEGDLISVRKFGRIQIVRFLGNTKKNRIILLVKIPK